MNSCLCLSEKEPHFCNDCVSDDDTVSEVSDDNEKKDNTATLLSLKQFTVTNPTIKMTTNSIHQNTTNPTKDTSDSLVPKVPATQIKCKIDNEISILSTEKNIIKCKRFLKMIIINLFPVIIKNVLMKLVMQHSYHQTNYKR
jgi:hypothetical protein